MTWPESLDWRDELKAGDVLETPGGNRCAILEAVKKSTGPKLLCVRVRRFNHSEKGKIFRVIGRSDLVAKKWRRFEEMEPV